MVEFIDNLILFAKNDHIFATLFTLMIITNVANFILNGPFSDDEE